MNTFVRVMTVSAVMAMAGFVGQALAATELVVVSWGGAYTASQQNAYHPPYMKKNPGIKIINDDSAGSAVAKLRAMKQAGNTTCLLYTSPSPRDGLLSRMPSSA